MGARLSRGAPGARPLSGGGERGRRGGPDARRPLVLQLPGVVRAAVLQGSERRRDRGQRRRMRRRRALREMGSAGAALLLGPTLKWRGAGPAPRGGGRPGGGPPPGPPPPPA